MEGFKTLGGDFISREQAAENIRRSGLAEGEYVPDVLHADTLNYLRSKGLWSNAPTASAVPLAGETQDTDPALLEYLKAIGLY